MVDYDFNEYGKRILPCFNDHWSLRFDPYRKEIGDEHYEHLFSLLFDDNGYLTDDGMKGILNILATVPAHELSYRDHPVALYHADKFANNTKGNYSTIYYFR